MFTATSTWDPTPPTGGVGGELQELAAMSAMQTVPVSNGRARTDAIDEIPRRDTLRIKREDRTFLANCMQSTATFVALA